MWSKVIGNKKSIIIIIAIITLLIVIIRVSAITYNIVYNKVVEENAIKEEKKKEKDKREKEWIAKITNTKGDQLNELVNLHKKYKLDSATLKIISELSTKFNVKPNNVMEALSVIDLSDFKTTKQRINFTLKTQKDKLYWLETKDVNKQAPWIKDKKEIITMCQIELALLDKVEKNREVKQKFQSLRTQYLHTLYPRLYPWKGPQSESGGGH